MHLRHDAGMPTSITVRNVPDDTRDELAARAASSHRSLQEYLRSALIALASRPDPELQPYVSEAREALARLARTD